MSAAELVQLGPEAGGRRNIHRRSGKQLLQRGGPLVRGRRYGAVDRLTHRSADGEVVLVGEGGKAGVLALVEEYLKASS